MSALWFLCCLTLQRLLVQSQGLLMWNYHVLPVCVWVLSGRYALIPQSRNTHGEQIRKSTLSVGLLLMTTGIESSRLINCKCRRKSSLLQEEQNRSEMSKRRQFNSLFSFTLDLSRPSRPPFWRTPFFCTKSNSFYIPGS